MRRFVFLWLLGTAAVLALCLAAAEIWLHRTPSMAGMRAVDDLRVALMLAAAGAYVVARPVPAVIEIAMGAIARKRKEAAPTSAAGAGVGAVNAELSQNAVLMGQE
jgi:hypothetical protein